MNRTEKDAAFIRQQKTRITRALSELSQIITREILDSSENPIYGISLDISMFMKGYSFQIRSYKTSGIIEMVEEYNIYSAIEDLSFGLISEGEGLLKVNAMIDEINRAKKIAKKYSKLNNQ